MIKQHMELSDIPPKIACSIHYLGLSLLFFSLAACQTAPPVEGPAVEPGSITEAAEAIEKETAQKGGLPLRQRLREIIKLLETGQEADAHNKLKGVLADYPNNKRANYLLEQINTDPEELLGKEYFSYKLESGDSLSVIAKRFLGDPLRFYALAKYNDIDNPKAVTTGQTIKVPGTIAPAEPPAHQPTAPVEEEIPPSAAPATEVKEEEQIAAIHNNAMQLAEAGNYAQAIAHLESGLMEFPDDTTGNSLLVHYYAIHAQDLSNSGNNQTAYKTLEKAALIAPENREIAQLITQIKKRLTAEEHYQSGKDYLAAGDLEKSYDAFSQALALYPDYQDAKEQLETLRSALIASLHKKAMTKYREQQLDQAIELWNKILKIDPSHLNAQVYRSQAQDLKMRIEKFEQKE